MHKQYSKSMSKSSFWDKIHIDFTLFFLILTLMTFGLFIVYSASAQEISLLIKQATRMGIGIFVMLLLAQIEPHQYQRWALFLYVIGIVLLIFVLISGHIGKGAQRWINLGFIRFQPSEIMKLAIPLMVAWFLSKKAIPPSLSNQFFAFIIIMLPTLLIVKQPDLGTSILIATSGLYVLFLSGMSWSIIIIALGGICAFVPIMWFYFMLPYQKQRVLTFLDPETNPLGAGYHIIQSKIAIGSGGMFGQGYLEGSQSQLEFLPERHTDFIFAVIGEEFGFFGVFILLLLYSLVIGRGLYIAVKAQQFFTRLLAGSIILTFFTYTFVNIGMVSGILPVVGLPLPIVSYGGTSMVTIMAGFGILMSIHTHKRLIST